MSLGKISAITIGNGGYQDAMFGVTIQLDTVDGSVTDFFPGAWSTPIPPHAKWTEEDREKGIGIAFNRLRVIMYDAKVDDAYKLVGKPVEVEFRNQSLGSWRILKEVL